MTARRNPVARSVFTIAALVVAGVAAFGFRAFQASGVFSSVNPGYSGACKSLLVAGVSDMEIDAPDRMAFLAVMNARHPGADDGIYALDLAGPPKLKRLSGAPADFHPRGIGLYHTANGGLFLAAVNHRANDKFSIDSFEITRNNGVVALAAQGTIEGGLLTDPQDVAMVAPNNFYVSNGITAKNAVMRTLQSYGILPGGDILYFNGMSFREAVNGLSGPRGLVLMPDGDHVLVANVTGRNILSLSREVFTGNLSEAGTLKLTAGADRLALDGQDNLWVAGHANLLTWRSAGLDAGTHAPSQIFRVRMANGVPKFAEQVYGNDGSEISGASIGAAAGKRLLVGSPLDGRLLDCEMP